MKKTTKLLEVLTLTAMFSIITMQGVVFAAAEPPVLPNPFGDAVETTDDSFPALELANTTTTTTTTTTPSPTPTPTPTPVHTAANDLPKSGPEAYILYMMVAGSLAGGYVYRLKKERN